MGSQVKTLGLGAVPITFSDSSGYIYASLSVAHEKDGFDKDKLEVLMNLKQDRNARVPGIGEI